MKLSQPNDNFWVIWLLASSIVATVGHSAFAGDINVIPANREDIGAFDRMLDKSRGAVAPKPRAGFSSAVSAEAQKARDSRERELQTGKNLGTWVKSQNKPETKGSSATLGDNQGQGSQSKLPPGKGHNGSGNGTGNASGSSHGH